jgi:hypothetical protein
MESLHQMVANKKREDEIRKKNETAKRRIESLNGLNAQTSSFLNVKEQLKGTIQAVKNILDPKIIETEYQSLLSHHDIMNTDVLSDVYDKLTKGIDRVHLRLFNDYVNLLLLSKHKSVLTNVQKNKKSVVTFSEEITLVEQEIKRQLQIKNQ